MRGRQEGVYNSSRMLINDSRDPPSNVWFDTTAMTSSAG
jgi:hypothetical protein